MNVVFNTGAIAGARKSSDSVSYYILKSEPPEPETPISEKVMRVLYDLLKRGFDVRFKPEFDGGICIYLHKDNFSICRRILPEELKYGRTTVEGHIAYVLEWLVAKYEHDRELMKEGKLDYGY